MKLPIYAERRERLREKMSALNIDALLVSYAPNRYYLSGFELKDGQCNETSGYLIITKDGKDLLCTDSRYELEAHSLWDKEQVHIYKGSIAEFYNKIFKQFAFSNVGFDEQCLTYAFMQKAFDGVSHTAAHGLVEDLRVIKDAHEIKLIRDSAKLNHQLMEHLPHYLKQVNEKKITESSLAWYIESYFREHNASENAFKPIVAKNEHAALPHCNPDDTILTENSLVLVDVGARLHDYNSDQTRTFWIGDKPSDRFLQVSDQVKEAQKAAIDILRPGLTGKQAYEASYNSFVKHGVEKYFTHNLGHGVGLETHEAPRLAPFATSALEAGMVVTVEPGLYYADWGGFRWEYMVLITEEGCEIL